MSDIDEEQSPQPLDAISHRLKRLADSPLIQRPYLTIATGVFCGLFVWAIFCTIIYLVLYAAGQIFR